MKRSLVVILSSFFLLVFIIGARMQRVQAQGGPMTPERKAAIEKQLALEAATPKLQLTEQILTLSVPGQTVGETEGVSKNAQGHLFVYSRTGKGGTARGGTAAELFEFDATLKFVKLWGPNNYAQSFAHAVRVDRHQNVWIVDEGAGMIVKFAPNGIVKMVLGRKTEAIGYLERFLERGDKIPETQRHPVGGVGTFNRPTDIAWDEQDNMYISDGYGNSRFVKIAKDGTWVKAVGTYGSGPDQFNTVHAIAYADGNVYVGDRGNFRIQVYDTNMNFKKSITGVGAPWGLTVSPKYLYSGDGTGKLYRLDHDGKLLGWAQTSLGQGQTGCLIHTLHAESDNVLYKGSCSEWNIEKFTIK